MCELLGMSSNVPTDICFSLTGLIKRGGATGPHRDGWGVVFYEDNGCRSFHDPQASADSKIADFVKSYPIKSRAVISHIRRANRGKVSLANTQPFCRELWGQYWTFAHNGQLKGIKKRPLKFYTPVGTTDSEHAFCWLLDSLRNHFKEKPPSMNRLAADLKDLCSQLNALGIFNVLLTNGKYLFAYCSTHLHWITRRAPFGEAQLIDAELVVDFKNETSVYDIVTVIATRPLTSNETWHKMQKNELMVFCEGNPSRA